MVTKFSEIFSVYQLHQVSVLKQHFEDHLSRHHQESDDQNGPQNVVSVDT
jgi:hypothetical protein